MDGSQIMYTDSTLVDTIVGELKSQGTFDQFRKECIADVDTKPAYQNLHQRVELTVANFLEGKVWRPDLNKNQLRDSLRKHIHEMGFLETGVERIVDQVVNPKVNPVFMPQVEDVVYRVQGIPKPEKKISTTSSSIVGSTSKSGGVFNSARFNQPPPFLPGLSFLPAVLQNHMQKAPTLADLLPTDLDPVSPESSKDSVEETEIKDDAENSNMVEETGIIQHHEDSMESQLSGISDLTSHGSEHGQSTNTKRRNSDVYEEANDDDSQFSKVSSNSRLSCEFDTEDRKEDKPENSSAGESEVQRRNGALETNYEDMNEKCSFPGGSVVEYEEQFTMEEEVATTLHKDHEEMSHEISARREKQGECAVMGEVLPETVKTIIDKMSLNDCSSTDKNLASSRYNNSDDNNTKFQDDNSIPQSEDSQLSGSSDNKLHIDEMKEFNSQSENSHHNEDEQSCIRTSSEGFISEESNKAKSCMENVVEASEEARHGFDDSQDALERPSHMPPPASNYESQLPLPPIPPNNKNSEERPPPPPPPPPPERSGASGRSSSPSSDYITPPTENLQECPSLLQTMPLYGLGPERTVSHPIECSAEKFETSNCQSLSTSSLSDGEVISRGLQEKSEHLSMEPSLSRRETVAASLPLATPPLPPATPPLPLATPPLPPATPPLPPATPPLPPATPPLPPATPPLPPATPPLPPTTPPLPPATPPLPPATPPLPPATPPLPPATPPLPPVTPPVPPANPPLPPATPCPLPATPPLPSETPSLPSATPPLPSATPPLPSAAPPLPLATPPLPAATPPLPSATPPLASATPPLPSAPPPLASATPPLPSATPPLPSATPPLPSATPPFPSSTLSLASAAPPLPSATPPLPCATPPLPCATPPLPSATPPLAATTPPLPSTTPPLPSTTPPLPSTTPPLPSTTPPLPSTTPPLPSTTPPLPSATPSLPSSTLLESSATFPMPLTNVPIPLAPSLLGKTDTSQCFPLPASEDERKNKCPLEAGGVSCTSPLYEEGAILKTPRWEQRSPKEEEKHSFGLLSTKSKVSQIPLVKKSDHDDESQSDSEEMQLAWSPLSAHGEDENEDSRERKSREALDKTSENFSGKISSAHLSAPKVAGLEKSSSTLEQTQGRVDKDRDRSKEGVCTKDEKMNERHKEDDRAHRNSSRKHDEKSKHSRDRKDSYSRSRHDDRNRSDKERDRHSSSSRRRSDDRKKDDKERSSSSRHKSSRSDDRHRHRDKERKNSSSGSSSVRHEDKSHDRSSKSEDKTKSSYKGHSNDRDKRERDRDNRDRDRKPEKDKDRSTKESVRPDEKKREKIRTDKNSTVCRPNKERRTPDPDSNNGSMFGGNNTTFSAFTSESNQDGNNQESGKGADCSDTNNKSTESSQQNESCLETSPLLSPNVHGLSSSLPFKKRPLLQDSESKSKLTGKLLLTIRKQNRSSKNILDSKAKKARALRKHEKRSVRDLMYLPKFSLKVGFQAESPPPESGSPTKYFESDWPSKSYDDAFLAYVQDLEQSKTLSGLSDYSGSDSEEEEILQLSDTQTTCGFENNIIFSLSILSDDQALQLSPKGSSISVSKTKKDFSDPKVNSAKVKNRTRRRKTTEDEYEGKRQRIHSKEVIEPAAIEQKTRRARKPNKRYSNDEFTSTFDYEDDLEDLEPIAEDENLESDDTPNEPKRVQCRFEEEVMSTSSYETKELQTSASNDQQEKENKIDIPSKSKSQAREPSYLWNRDSYNSNSEDEMDNPNSENDLIGTALKNLMRESGFCGPDEVSGSDRPSKSSNTEVNITNTLAGKQQKLIPLSGVKRVGLSKKYKGSKNLSVKPAVAAATLSDFTLPLSPDSDVSASTYYKVPRKKMKAACSTDDVNMETSRLDSSRVKQHYSSDDLYKPRPPLRLTSKRRQVMTE